MDQHDTLTGKLLQLRRGRHGRLHDAFEEHVELHRVGVRVGVRRHVAHPQERCVQPRMVALHRRKRLHRLGSGPRQHEAACGDRYSHPQEAGAIDHLRTIWIVNLQARDLAASRSRFTASTLQARDTQFSEVIRLQDGRGVVEDIGIADDDRLLASLCVIVEMDARLYRELNVDIADKVSLGMNVYQVPQKVLDVVRLSPNEGFLNHLGVRVERDAGDALPQSLSSCICHPVSLPPSL
mmetsp:Transcript_130250/g.337811  ORF Transcript_130250/g.337811 Transcript_130250/m.337811 type:complete len:238 (+) Transcript_130250:4171-4884(+)